MQKVHYHPDNIISVESGADLYQDSIDNFEADSSETINLPTGYSVRMRSQFSSG